MNNIQKGNIMDKNAPNINFTFNFTLYFSHNVLPNVAVTGIK